MRTTRLAFTWSAIVLMSGVGAACTTATRTTPDGLRADGGLGQTTAAERRELRDSAAAQAVADEVGPRATVRADFDYAGGGRQVDATFHMYDDAYVIVGHLDAAGRMRVVFPSQPGDDGFVRGDNIYHVPSFFAGFNDEYAWRYSNYRNSAHNYASRRDSYDAGLGYIFVIASWRPMRLDRITDGNRWQTYEVADVNYMSDPREAVEELGSVIAGDNREAYTIEYAHYSTTNYGTYALSDFDAVNSGCRSYGSALGFGRLGYSFFGGYGFMPTAGFAYGQNSCQSSFGAGYPFGYGYGYSYGYPVVYVPFAPPIRRGALTTPFGLPPLHVPRIDGGTGGLALRPTGGATPGSVVGTSQYRRPGLIAEEAGGRRTPGERRGIGDDVGFTSRRPTIQQMLGPRRAEETRAGLRGFSRDNPSLPGASGSARASGQQGRWSQAQGAHGEATRAAPTHAQPHGGESARSAPPRSEPAAHAAPAHSQPAARSAPPASTGSKKS